mgnify:FL=1
MKITKQALRKVIREQHQNHDYDDPLGGSGDDYVDGNHVEIGDVEELRYSLRTAIGNG